MAGLLTRPVVTPSASPCCRDRIPTSGVINLEGRYERKVVASASGGSKIGLKRGVRIRPFEVVDILLIVGKRKLS